MSLDDPERLSKRLLRQLLYAAGVTTGEVIGHGTVFVTAIELALAGEHDDVSQLEAELRNAIASYKVSMNGTHARSNREMQRIAAGKGPTPPTGFSSAQ